ncbi:MAG: hypothetical protein ACLSV2_08485 [Clostridium sp.]
MDKSLKFTPTKEEACKLADNYWADLTEYREKTLKYISEAISANALSGKYEITCEIIKDEKDYIKEKLEDVGYEVRVLDNHKDEKYTYVVIVFGEKKI